jgi:hypothetical protein
MLTLIHDDGLADSRVELLKNEKKSCLNLSSGNHVHGEESGAFTLSSSVE